MTTYIADLGIANQASGDDVSQKNIEYLAHQHQVLMVNNIFNGRDTAAQYLFKFPQELVTTFDTRKERATLRNFVKRAVEAFVGMIFRKPVEIANYGPRTTKLFEKIDTANDIKTFTKQVATATTKDGSCFLLVDSPSALVEDKVAAVDAPYLILVERQSLINWRKDVYGNYTMIVIEEIVAEPNGLFGTTYIRQWRHYDEQGNINIWRKTDNNNKLNTNGSNFYIYMEYQTEFTSIPIVEIVIDPTPILYDIAAMNIKHFNRQSHKDRYLTMAALPIPVIWGADISEDGVVEGAKPALIIGVDEAFIFQGTKDEADFQWRELSGTSVDLLEDDLNSITEDITTGILRAAETANAVQKTATEVQLLQAEASNRVTSISSAVETGMKEALSLLSTVNKETVPANAVFLINKDFNASLMGSDGARVVLESYLMGLISVETFLQTLSDMELINIDSAKQELERVKADTFQPESNAPEVEDTDPVSDKTDNRLKGAAEA